MMNVQCDVRASKLLDTVLGDDGLAIEVFYVNIFPVRLLRHRGKAGPEDTLRSAGVRCVYEHLPLFNFLWEREYICSAYEGRRNKPSL